MGSGRKSTFSQSALTVSTLRWSAFALSISVPQLTRSLIGDVAIDFLPGSGQGLIVTSSDPAKAPVIEGGVAPDPSKALAAATLAFQKAGSTLESIELAAGGIAKLINEKEFSQIFLAASCTV